jgi:hypothetical protein
VAKLILNTRVVGDVMNEYIVKVTSTWLVEAEDESEARDIFSDGIMLDLNEDVELNRELEDD